MSAPQTISFEKVQKFHKENPDFEVMYSYFMGICTTLTPLIQNLSSFESTRYWSISLNHKCIQLKKREIDYLARHIFKLSDPNYYACKYEWRFQLPYEEDFDPSQIQPIAEKVACWFKDFGVMKVFFPSFTNLEWFVIGTFMAEQTSVNLFVLLSMVETDFKSQIKDLDEHSQRKLLKALLESYSKILQKENCPKFDIEILRKNLLRYKIQQYMSNEIEVEVNRGDQSKKGKAKAKGKENGKANRNSKSQQNTKLNKEKEKEVLPRRQVECSICLEMADENSLTSLALCQHSFHLRCLQQHLRIRINERHFPMICPMDGCSLKILGSEICKLLSEEYKNKYHAYSLNHFIDTHRSEISKCSEVDCKSLAWRKDEKTFSCLKCNKAFCADCRSPHDGMSCKEYEITMRVDENDDLFRTLMQGDACQKCSSCGSFIEKTEGCNHITCRCTNEFCYLCGTKWKTCPCEQYEGERAHAEEEEELARQEEELQRLELQFERERQEQERLELEQQERERLELQERQDQQEEQGGE